MDRTDLAPYASMGGHSAYSFQGSLTQEVNFLQALHRRRGAVGILGRLAIWLVLALILLGIGSALWSLFTR